MPQLLLDKIIFQLQGNGGVSSLWRAILNELEKCDSLDFRVVSGLGIQRQFKLPYSIARYLRERSPLSGRSVFHSSYFRIHADSKVQNITTVHDFVYEKYDSGLRKRIHLWQKSKALTNSQTIICVSENTKNDLLEHHPLIAPETVHVIHNGVSESFFKKPESRSPSDRPYLIYVGSRTCHKNFIKALELLTTPEAQSIDLMLLAVGGGALSQEELSMVEKLKVKDKIELRLGVDNTTLNGLYNNAFALVYPSLYEGFGIPPLEAMAAGCPVIASNSSSIPEVTGGAALLFDPHNLEEAASRLSELLDSTKRALWVQRGLIRAHELPMSKTAKKTVELYKQLLQVQ